MSAERFYSEDEARDADGKWTTGGGGEASTLTKPQAAALRNYQSSGYLDINAVLRGSPEAKTLSENAKRIVKERVSALDAAIAAAPPLAEEAVVFRGLNLRAGFKPEVGATFTDKAFVSTSLDRSAAEAFRDRGGARPTALVEIHVPAGMRGLRVEGVSKRSNENMRKEKEILLRRGSRFVVTSVATDPRGGYRLAVRAA